MLLRDKYLRHVKIWKNDGEDAAKTFDARGKEGYQGGSVGSGSATPELMSMSEGIETVKVGHNAATC